MENYRYLTDSGVIVADTADVRTTVENEFKAAFGLDLVTTDDTPQGTLINMETAARVEVMRNNAALATAVINPRIAGGIFLDGIASFLDLERRPATYSYLYGVQVAGQPNTPIPAGARGTDEAGVIWILAAGVVLDSGGQGSGTFRCSVPGPVQCATGSLANVTDMVLGWETVYNPSPATLGQTQESDAAFRRRRVNTLGKQGISVNAAIKAALYDSPVYAKSIAYRENYSDAPMTIDGKYLKANSIWACVDGGSDYDVADALLRTKTVGAGWNGAVEVSVLDESSGQTYDVAFDRPEYVQVEVQLRVVRALYTGDPVLDIPPAVVNYAEGNVENMAGFVLNTKLLSPDQIAAGVVAQLPGLYVVNTRVRKVGTPTWPDGPLALEIWQKPVTSTGLVSVEVLS